jgi:threonine synthase
MLIESSYEGGGRRGSLYKRFSKEYPYITPEYVVSLGETETPLVEGERGVHFKLDYLLPTGSFKDRGSWAMISALIPHLFGRGLRKIKEDSSGNAGASVAAYAARAGIECSIYVPAGAAGPKTDQIRGYGAELHRIEGSRNDVTKAAQSSAEDGAYVGHIWHPLFRDGIRTLAYEMIEQMGGRMPESVFLPVSAGTLLLGFLAGVQHLRKSGAISSPPHIVACQTEIVSPLFHRWMGLSYTTPASTDSLADALVSHDPPLLDRMVASLKEVDGECVTVGEGELVRAWKELSRKGFFVEPSSAVAYAGLKKKRESQGWGIGESVIVLTGSGLKAKPEALRLLQHDGKRV